MSKQHAMSSGDQHNVLKSDIALFAFIVLFFGAAIAMAGSDATFSSFVTTIRSWLSGSFGLLVTLIALVVSVLAAMFGEMGKLAIAFAIALICTIVPAILVGLFTYSL